ncbi:DNA internalization-related competence protein ComEC/Rec2 [Shewanella youngdeokensis]|uniref:DNA internalization-related competence protein ComEC/Rec2 n=1 Tax=Shewanella youngdeokensis TaxID=2999068 RepID=A0ABZ0K357_9GAMM|nr:DNA internalization-related competence protein ComEC/Rec2 [Shewanella sp. DAU334]
MWPLLPQLSVLPLCVFIAVVAIQRFPMLSGCLIALSWITLFNTLLMSWEKSENGVAINLEAEIISLVHANGDWISIDIVPVDSILPHKLNRKFRLSWSNPPPVKVGERWQLTIKPKSITAPLNKGGFNAQKYMLSQRIFAKGKIVTGQLIEDNIGARELLIRQLHIALTGYSANDLLQALMVGDRSLMTAERWLQLRNTGTGHLFAISGLHLSVASFWIYLLTKLFLFRVFPTQGRRNSVTAMLVCAFAAIAYAYLAGFSVSTQRALIMLLVYLLSWLMHRHASSWERLLYALFIVLCLDPLAPLSASFWLSFIALVVILLTISTIDTVNQSAITLESTAETLDDLAEREPQSAIGRLRLLIQQWLTAFWAIQWRLAIVLGVIQAIFFSGTSLISIVVNCVVVPWFSFVVLPVSLLSLLLFICGLFLGFSASSINVFAAAQLSMEPVLMMLDWAGELSFAWLDLSSQWIAAFIYGLLGVWLIRQCQLTNLRLVLSVMLLPIILLSFSSFISAEHSNNERWKAHLLDVGQGLAVVIERNGRAIIYDTAARYGTTFSYAKRVILPFLTKSGIKDIDYIIISHADNDHAGGVDVIMEAYPNATVIADDKRWGSINCRPKVLQWQSIKLNIIGPKVAHKGNNGSCVVRLSKGNNSLLLTGDIESKAEQALLLTDNIASDVMTAPHHGSRTSSTRAFIKAVSPQLVLFAAGHNNRYGFPKADVLARYHKLGITSQVSGEQGQVSVFFEPDGFHYQTYRADFAPFWYNQVFRFGEFSNPE